MDDIEVAIAKLRHKIDAQLKHESLAVIFPVLFATLADLYCYYTGHPQSPLNAEEKSALTVSFRESLQELQAVVDGGCKDWQPLRDDIAYR